LRENSVGELGVSGRIEAVMPAGQDGDGTGGETRAVRGTVDAAREPRDDGKARFAEVLREPLGEAHARSGCIAGADDGDRGQSECGGVPCAPLTPPPKRSEIGGGEGAIAQSSRKRRGQ